MIAYIPLGKSNYLRYLLAHFIGKRKRKGNSKDDYDTQVEKR